MSHYLPSFQFRDAKNRTWSICMDAACVGRIVEVFNRTSIMYCDHHGLQHVRRPCTVQTMGEYLYVIARQDPNITRHQVAAAIMPQLKADYIEPLEWAETMLPDGEIFKAARLALSSGYSSRWPLIERSRYDWMVATFGREN